MAKLALNAVLTVAMFAGCSFGDGSFHCTSDQQCTPGGGKCVPETNYCAFPASDCPYRYGELSGSLSGLCVGGGSGADAKTYLDAPEMVKMDASGPVCYGNGLGVSVCFAAAPSGAMMLPSTIDTGGSSPDCSTLPTNPLASAWCVIAAGNITAGTVAVKGSRPLVVIATSMINVTGAFDVASHRAGAQTNPGQVGPGSITTNDATSCNPGTNPAVSGGGAGGSFATKGGAGGAATAGTAGNTTATATLRGGCYGQNGAGILAGARGLGGGAIYLFASSTITIENNGLVNASGAAGSSGNPPGTGGGGGGSGGMIVFDAPSIVNNGSVFANGGGGAEGSGSMTAVGNDGVEPTSTAPSGGSGDGAANGGDGGSGAAQNAAGSAGGAGQSGGGGGGGGGGVGVIRVFGGGTLGGNHSP